MGDIRRALLVVVVVLWPTQLPAQAVGPILSGYRVGARDIDMRSIPCELMERDFLCQPSSDTWLRFRNGELVEISESRWEPGSDEVTATDLWTKVRPVVARQFGTSDSVRMFNNLPPAYFDGLVAFWIKPEAAWCANVKVKILGRGRFRPTSIIEMTIEKRGTWYQDCSAYPELNPHKR
jgi:hypothetical protein